MYRYNILIANNGRGLIQFSVKAASVADLGKWTVFRSENGATIAQYRTSELVGFTRSQAGQDDRVSELEKENKELKRDLLDTANQLQSERGPD